jgi:phosphate-selective porin OprO/OprP
MKGSSIKFNTTAESEIQRDKYVSVKVKDVDVVREKNLSLLYINGKYSLQGEYTKVNEDAVIDNYAFYSYYIEGSYFLYGDGREYKQSSATLSRAKPYGWGALEFALRYSYINLNDKGNSGVHPEEGGTQKDYNYGINWYFNKEMSFMFNYIVAYPKVIDEYDGRLEIVEARARFAF